jgi:hypothetical protein
MKQTMSLLGGAAGPGRVGAPPENAVRFALEPGSLSSPLVSSLRTNAGAVAGYGRGREWRRRNKLVDVAPADGLHLGRHCLDGFAGRVGVDVAPTGASLAGRWMRQPRKSRPSSMWVIFVFSADRRRLVREGARGACPLSASGPSLPSSR